MFRLEQARLHATKENDKERLAMSRATIDSLSRQVDGLQKMQSAQEETIAKQEKVSKTDFMI